MGTFVLRFRCPNCSTKLTSPEDRAGTVAVCPKCRNTVAVPKVQPPGPALEQKDSGELPIHSGDPAYDVALLDIASRGAGSHEVTSGCQESDGLPELDERSSAQECEPAPAAGSRLPWFVDVFLYPLDRAGIVHLVGLWLLVCWLCPFVMATFGLSWEFVPFVYGLPVAYVAYYLAECLRHSAGGGRRLPDFWLHPADSSKWECLSQFFLVVGCIAVCFAPASTYYFLRERTDWVYWLLLVGGGFFFPMVLLAAVLFDSPSAVNPILIIASIFSTFVPYCGLVLLFYGGAWLFVSIDFRVYGFGPMPTLPFVLRVVQLYLLLVAIGLLGRFYRRYRERLNWEV